MDSLAIKQGKSARSPNASTSKSLKYGLVFGLVLVVAAAAVLLPLYFTGKLTKKKSGTADNTDDTDKYMWQQQPSGACVIGDAKCGNGTQSFIVTCINAQSKKLADNAKCSGSTQPDTTTPCNVGCKTDEVCTKGACGKKPPTNYACVNGTCTPSATGLYRDDTCNSECKLPVLAKYACEQNICVSKLDGSGTYADIAACKDECKAPAQTMYACVNGTCTPSATGLYRDDTCNSECKLPVLAKYACEQNICVSKLDGSGTYADIAACKDECKAPAQTMYACVNGTCTPSATGLYRDNTCGGGCYKCGVAPGTCDGVTSPIVGKYRTMDSCKAGCSNAPPTKLTQWFTPELFDSLMPYSGISAIYADDGQPFYTHEAFMSAIDFMNNHENKDYHGFGTSGSDEQNKLELAAFFANIAEEIGTGAITFPNCGDTPTNLPAAVIPGALGGGVATIEGALPAFDQQSGSAGCASPSMPIKNTTGATKITGCDTLCVTGAGYTPLESRSLNPSPTSTNLNSGGCVFNALLDKKTGLPINSGFSNYACVSSSGQLWQGNPSSVQALITNSKTKHLFDDIKTATYKSLTECASDDPTCRCMTWDYACQYPGRGPTQLTGNINYTDCSLGLFKDIRLVKWPNLMTATNRESEPANTYIDMCSKTTKPSEKCKSLFTFPGAIKLPQEIIDDTPPARVLTWLSTLYFWMDKNRSQASISCHDAVLDPTLGFSCATDIINGNGCKAAKLDYYPGICAVIGVAPGDICGVTPDFDPIAKCREVPILPCQTNDDCPMYVKCNPNTHQCMSHTCSSVTAPDSSNAEAYPGPCGTSAADDPDANFSLYNYTIPCCCPYGTVPDDPNSPVFCHLKNPPETDDCDPQCGDGQGCYNGTCKPLPDTGFALYQQSSGETSEFRCCPAKSWDNPIFKTEDECKTTCGNKGQAPYSNTINCKDSYAAAACL